MKDYIVRLPIEVEGRIYTAGETISLNDETAKAYQHSLKPAPATPAEEN